MRTRRFDEKEEEERWFAASGAKKVKKGGR
jgi:hypothetical protein